MHFDINVRSLYPPACFCLGFLLGRFCGFLRIVAGYCFGSNENFLLPTHRQFRTYAILRVARVLRGQTGKKTHTGSLTQPNR